MGADMGIIGMVLTRICWQSVVKTETNKPLIAMGVEEFLY
jgi:hypothetical protein